MGSLELGLCSGGISPFFMIFLILDLLFWNQIFTCERGGERRETHTVRAGRGQRGSLRDPPPLPGPARPGPQRPEPRTCVCVSPSEAASSARSGRARYWVFWNLLCNAAS